MRTFTRLAGTLAAAAFAASTAQAAAVNLVTNGGFETGDFSGWTPVGDQNFSAVFCPGLGDVSVVEGGCSAFFGPIGATAGISQTLNSLIVGAQYLISFAVQSDGNAPNSFSASFGGVNLVSLTNLPGTIGGPFRQFGFKVTAAASSQTLAFNFRDDPGLLLFDAVSVTIPEPTTLALVGAALAGLGAARRRRPALSATTA